MHMRRDTRRPHLAGRHERFGALAVPTTVARGDEVGDAAALEERGLLDPGVELVAEPHHFHQTDANDGGLGVASKPQPIHETRTNGHDVLQRTAQFHGCRSGGHW